MAVFVPGRVVIDAAQRKRGKYMDKCAAIGYGFLPFSFSSLGEFEADAVILVKRIQKFSMTQYIGARAVVHIFNRIGFSIAKGLPSATSGSEQTSGSNLGMCHLPRNVLEVGEWGLTPTSVNSAHAPSRGGRDSRVSHESTTDCLDKQPSRSGLTSDRKHMGVTITAVSIVGLSFGMKG
ncbi:hypothetical protein Tco_1393111 [Tanacetum coccineum]